MKTRFIVAATLCVLALAGTGLMSNAFGQDKNKAPKAAKAGKMSNVQGKVGKVDKDSITVLVGTSPKPVMINADTKFLFGHSNDSKPGSIAAVKQGNFIACSVSVDAKSQYVAKQCVYRDKQ